MLGVVGLGKMGAGIVRRLARAGLDSVLCKQSLCS